MTVDDADQAHLYMGRHQPQDYSGFEQGPIRPPSEARSLLIRVTRNCPWNKCTFCSVYKDEKFSLRPLDHILKDIDSIHAVITHIRSRLEKRAALSRAELDLEAGLHFGGERQMFYAAVDWLVNGDGAVFLQDANSLIMKPDQLCTVLKYLRDRFPWVSRITSYARSHTINRMPPGALEQLAEAGLNRIHIGMESGSDRVLAAIKKGVTRQGHIKAGLAVKKAGVELSEYIMPGLGGRELSQEHAVETASALNLINPDFIRLRSLTLQPGSPLYAQYRAGAFRKNTEMETIIEIRTLVGNLEGINATLKSDHVYNLLQEIEGVLPGDKQKMLDTLDRFLALDQDEQVLFQFGRRMGYFHVLDDLSSPARRSYVNQVGDKYQITPENIEHVLEAQTPNYI